jgi:RNA polymerase sigma-70 factor, ECF subfamily
MNLARVVPVAFDLERELVAVHPLLVRRLTLVLRDDDDAQDIAQAAVARAIERRSSFHGGDVRAWLYTIGIRLALNELRRRKRFVVLTGATAPEWAMRSDPDLWLALAELEPSHRAALVLTTLDGYTHAEVARMLGVREGTVSSWLSRSKERLRVLLRDDR